MKDYMTGPSTKVHFLLKRDTQKISKIFVMFYMSTFKDVYSHLTSSAAFCAFWSWRVGKVRPSQQNSSSIHQGLYFKELEARDFCSIRFLALVDQKNDSPILGLTKPLYFSERRVC
jgi:hypothetical protein